jgi:hypothetical protein
MIMMLVLIAWLSMSAVVVLLCAAASRADRRAEEASRASALLIQRAMASAAVSEVPGDGSQPIAASRLGRNGATFLAGT